MESDDVREALTKLSLVASTATHKVLGRTLAIPSVAARRRASAPFRSTDLVELAGQLRAVLDKSGHRGRVFGALQNDAMKTRGRVIVDMNGRVQGKADVSNFIEGFSHVDAPVDERPSADSDSEHDGSAPTTPVLDFAVATTGRRDVLATRAAAYICQLQFLVVSGVKVCYPLIFLTMPSLQKLSSELSLALDQVERVLHRFDIFVALHVFDCASENRVLMQGGRPAVVCGVHGLKNIRNATVGRRRLSWLLDPPEGDPGSTTLWHVETLRARVVGIGWTRQLPVSLALVDLEAVFMWWMDLCEKPGHINTLRSMTKKTFDMTGSHKMDPELVFQLSSDEFIRVVELAANDAPSMVGCRGGSPPGRLPYREQLEGWLSVLALMEQLRKLILLNEALSKLTYLAWIEELTDVQRQFTHQYNWLTFGKKARSSSKNQKEKPLPFISDATFVYFIKESITSLCATVRMLVEQEGVEPVPYRLSNQDYLEFLFGTARQGQGGAGRNPTPKEYGATIGKVRQDIVHKSDQPKEGASRTAKRKGKKTTKEGAQKQKKKKTQRGVPA